MARDLVFVDITADLGRALPLPLLYIANASASPIELLRLYLAVRGRVAFAEVALDFPFGFALFAICYIVARALLKKLEWLVALAPLALALTVVPFRRHFVRRGTSLFDIFAPYASCS